MRIVVLISARQEWDAVCALFPEIRLESAPCGAWFETPLAVHGSAQPVIFMHGGWGKIPAAASTQYAVDRWSPDLLVNLGTCGGFEGQIERGAIVLAERTVIYDVVERMGDYEAALRHFSTEIDLSWLGGDLPMPVVKTILVSADRDLEPAEIPALRARYHAVAGDWESGAIAYVAAQNGVRCLILRGVSDLVGAQGGEAYGKLDFFTQATQSIMRRLVEALPEWIALC
jgi:adenosylhomocysteine nucleosidase